MGALDDSSQSFLVASLGVRLRGPHPRPHRPGLIRQRDSTGRPEAGGQGQDTETCESQGQGRALQLRWKGLSLGFSQICTLSKQNSFCHACRQTRLRSPSSQRPPPHQALVSTGPALRTTPGSAALEVCTLESLNLCSVASNLVRRWTPQLIWI